MKISTAILCDFAEVRDNLLFVVAGGVTRLFRAEWPGPMNVCLAMMVELDRTERETPHELDVQVIDEDGRPVARIQGAFQQGAGPDVDFHEITFFPFTFDLRQVGILHVGWHSIEISIDSKPHHTLRFRTGTPPLPAPLE